MLSHCHVSLVTRPRSISSSLLAQCISVPAPSLPWVPSSLSLASHCLPCYVSFIRWLLSINNRLIRPLSGGTTAFTVVSRHVDTCPTHPSHCAKKCFSAERNRLFSSCTLSPCGSPSPYPLCLSMAFLATPVETEPHRSLSGPQQYYVSYFSHYCNIGPDKHLKGGGVYLGGLRGTSMMVRKSWQQELEGHAAPAGGKWEAKNASAWLVFSF